MKTIKIASKQADIKLVSINPNYKYHFKEANKPIEVKEEHAEKILTNDTFYKYNSKKGDN